MGLGVIASVGLVLLALHDGSLRLPGNGTYQFLRHQPGSTILPVTYSSCRPILVEINTDGVDDRTLARNTVLQAMGEVSAATGRAVVYVGPSSRRASWPAPPLTLVGGELPVLVSFATPDQLRALVGHAGVAGSSAVVREGVATYVTGQAVLNSDVIDRYLAEPGGEAMARAIAMHELGHVVGLGHVDDKREIMYPRAQREQLEFGPGDRRGLALLGQGPCT